MIASLGQHPPGRGSRARGKIKMGSICLASFSFPLRSHGKLICWSFTHKCNLTLKHFVSLSLDNLVSFSRFQRILVATNLFGRGMDIERVNIVFNYDMPEDTDTYLHRVARAGRFGTKGLAITFVSDETDAKVLNEVQDRFEVDITELPEEIDLSTYIEGR